MRRPPGFTLLEILVAFAIAAIALTALTAAVAGSLRSSRVASVTEQAISRAQSRLDAASLAPLGERSGDDGGGFRWREIVRQVGRSGTAALYDITVEITWTVDGPHRLALHSFRLAAAAQDRP
jgi:general secretion pathway protein I